MEIKRFTPRKQRIFYEGVRTVIKPWVTNDTELNNLCSDAVRLASKGEYDQQIFFYYILETKLNRLILMNLMSQEGLNKIMSMIRSTDKEMSELGLITIKNLVKNETIREGDASKQ